MVTKHFIGKEIFIKSNNGAYKIENADLSNEITVYPVGLVKGFQSKLKRFEINSNNYERFLR